MIEKGKTEHCPAARLPSSRWFNHLPGSSLVPHSLIALSKLSNISLHSPYKWSPSFPLKNTSSSCNVSPSFTLSPFSPCLHPLFLSPFYPLISSLSSPSPPSTKSSSSPIIFLLPQDSSSLKNPTHPLPSPNSPSFTSRPCPSPPSAASATWLDGSWTTPLCIHNQPTLDYFTPGQY